MPDVKGDPGRLLAHVAPPLDRRRPAAIDFYNNVLGASQRMRIAMPDGRTAHAEIGDSVIERYRWLNETLVIARGRILGKHEIE